MKIIKVDEDRKSYHDVKMKRDGNFGPHLFSKIFIMKTLFLFIPNWMLSVKSKSSIDYNLCFDVVLFIINFCFVIFYFTFFCIIYYLWVQ